MVKRSQGIDGRATGHVHTNPLFDTSEYETEFTHGTRDKYTANLIAENMFVLVDDDGNQFHLLADI